MIGSKQIASPIQILLNGYPVAEPRVFSEPLREIRSPPVIAQQKGQSVLWGFPPVINVIQMPSSDTD